MPLGAAQKHQEGEEEAARAHSMRGVLYLMLQHLPETEGLAAA